LIDRAPIVHTAALSLVDAALGSRSNFARLLRGCIQQFMLHIDPSINHGWINAVNDGSTGTSTPISLPAALHLR
jgi:hypothetical protein